MIEDVRKELALATVLQQENIVSCFGGSLSENYIIVMELMHRGSLKDLIADNTKVLFIFYYYYYIIYFFFSFFYVFLFLFNI